MYSGQDLLTSIKECSQTIDACIKSLMKHGRTKAETEMNYRIALAQKILTERDKGTPVTIISDICRGDKEIAKAKCNRDIAETMYEVVMQKIYATKLELSVLENQYKIEYREGRN